MCERIGLGLRKIKGKTAVAAAAVLPFLHEPDLLKWTEALSKGAATTYDKAMDLEYLKTGIGGSYHRLFDGGHTIWGSLKAVRDALPDDSPLQEAAGWIQAYAKDLTTVRGMPFFDLDKADFDQWAEALVGAIPGVKKEYLFDLLNFDAIEVCAAGLSVVGAVFALKRNDRKKLAELIGATGVTSVAYGNPISALATIGVMGYAFWKHGGTEVSTIVKGGGLAGVSTLLFSLLGMPVVVELVIVLAVIVLLRKQVLENQALEKWIKEKFATAMTVGSELLKPEVIAAALPARSRRGQ